MAQENIYPFTVAGEDIQRLLPESIGAAFKMVWDAPADSPEVLKQAGEKLFCARGALEKNASNQDAVCDSLRYLQLTRGPEPYLPQQGPVSRCIPGALPRLSSQGRDEHRRRPQKLPSRRNH